MQNTFALVSSLMIALFTAHFTDAQASSTLTATPAPSPTVFAGAPTLQQIIDRRTSESPGSGIIVAHIEPGRITTLVSGVSGTSRPLDGQSLFELGPMTETLTATLLATMVLDGSVKLDDPISKYLPKSLSKNSSARPITILDLAEHRSGLPRLPANLFRFRPGGALRLASVANPYATYSEAEMDAFLEGHGLSMSTEPSYRDSILGLALLGRVLANSAHETFPQLLQERVLGPLHMDDTTFEVSETQKPRFTVGRDYNGDVTEPWTFAAMAPAEGLHSNLDDMIKFARCNMGQGPLKAACLFAQEPRADMQNQQRIGLVWWTGRRLPIVHMAGDTVSDSASITLSADRSEASIVLANGGRYTEDVALHVIDPPIVVANAPQTFPLDAGTLTSYAGGYEAAGRLGTHTLAIIDDGTRLLARVDDFEPAPMFATCLDTFESRTVDANIRFNRDRSKTPVAAVLSRAGISVAFFRPGVLPTLELASAFPTMITLDSVTLDGYVGTYGSVQGIFTVVRDGTGIVVQLEGNAPLPVYATARDAFYYRKINATIEFKRDSLGKITGLAYHRYGDTVEGKRK